MFDLTKQEKVILIFLASTFITGLGVSSYKKSQQSVKLQVQPYKINTAREEADKFIEDYSLININSLEIDQLNRLPGVGDKIAARIVDYRKRHGPFRAKEELMQVKGIGEKKFEKIKDLIILK